ncbi:MAG: ABC transporter permease [Armatimonadetes bacterium]|nr:ABC transporter permease [Armatimonadota bacterium]
MAESVVTTRSALALPTVRGRALRVFLKHRLAVFGLVVMAIVASTAVAAPWLEPYPYFEQNYDVVLKPPGRDHLLGTDNLGRDTLSRMIRGARTSLGVASAGGGMAIGIGVMVGSVAALWGGWYDYFLMRATDILMSIPTIFLALLTIAIFGQGISNLIWVLALVFWPGTARIVRAQCLAIRNMEFVMATESVGSTRWRILHRHLLPNATAVIIVQATIFVAQAVLIETSLSYLGVGAQPPLPSWGNMLNEGQRYIRETWWLVIFPGAAIFLTVFALNMLGDGLRDALDPRSQHRL